MSLVPGAPKKGKYPYTVGFNTSNNDNNDNNDNSVAVAAAAAAAAPPPPPHRVPPSSSNDRTTATLLHTRGGGGGGGGGGGVELVTLSRADKATALLVRAVEEELEKSTKRRGDGAHVCNYYSSHAFIRST